MSENKKSNSLDSSINYVDEDGNEIDPNTIDPNEMDFFDDYGRPVDQNGKLIESDVSLDNAVGIAERLLVSQLIEELHTHCKLYISQYPNSSPLHMLLGISYGSMGDATKARASFLTSLKIDPANSMALANYFTACLHDNDSASAVEGLNLFFNGMADDHKEVVIESVVEALKVKTLSVEELPVTMIPIISQKMRELSVKKKIKVSQIETNKFLEYWNYEETKKQYSGLLIKQVGENYTDKHLVDFLNFKNSYCLFEIVEDQDEK